MSAVAALAAVVILLAAAPIAGARGIGSGVITVGRGVNGVLLGMDRAQVVAKLGRPLAENQFGTMSYEPSTAMKIFDVYRTARAPQGTVDEFVISSPRDSHFRLSDGNRIFTTGGLRRLATRYGRALRFHRFDDGSPYYELVGRFHGKTVRTAFPTDKRGLDAYVLNVFISIR